MRDHNKGDVALTGLTLAVAVAAVTHEAVQWAARRDLRRLRFLQRLQPTSK